MGIKLTNNANATLAAGINSSATSITLTSGQGARFPTLTASDYFYATLVDTSNNLEIVKCTARSTDVLTVVRAQESTTARAYSTGDRIEIRITAQTFLDATTIYDILTSSTGYFDLPSGTTAQRPGSPAEGMFRHNTDLDVIEFYDSGAWKSVNASYPVDYLVVAGGGGGGGAGAGNSGAGGGGAGGYTAVANYALASGTSFAVTVGAGGAGGGAFDRAGTSNIDAAAGANSVFGALTTTIGGGAAPNSNSNYNSSVRNGGSGAGGTGNTSSSTGFPGSGTAGQGNAGGQSSYGGGSGWYGAGGGGGASAVGDNASTSSFLGGNGGAGTTWLDGVAYAGGGGGGTYNSGTFTSGGAGGGGAGGGNANTPGGNGTANRGGGGGGTAGSASAGSAQPGGNGSSGIVIIRYAGTQKGSGGTVTSASGYTYHTFTTSGTFTA
jgi:hypothetical protein